MDDRLKESISALVDDEANELEVQRVLNSRDEDLAETWMRYHQIRDVIRSSDPEIMAIDIRDSLALELADIDDLDALGEPGTVNLDGAGEQKARPAALAPFKRSRVAGFVGIAASGVLALFLATQFQQSLQREHAQEQLAQTSELEQNSALELAALNTDESRDPVVIHEFNEEQAKRFNEYLLRHAEHSSFGLGRGVMPLARVASVNSVGI